jgi:IS4 transposase
VVRSRKTKRAKGTTTAGETRREKRTTVMPAKSMGAPGSSSIKTVARKVPGQATRNAMLPRTLRASAVTVTLSGAARTSYAEVLAQAREKISLKELGVEKVEMRKAVTGAIIIRSRRQG